MKTRTLFVAVAALLAVTATSAIAAHKDFGIPRSQMEGVKNAVKSDGSLRPQSVGEHQLKNEVIGCEKLAKYLRPRVCGRLGLGGNGKDGANGAAGANGLQGALGDPGPAGPTGATGPTGPTGPRGYKGWKGPKGDTGPRGYPGDNGKDGKDGQNADNPEGGHWAPFCEIGNSIHPGLCPEDQDQKTQVYLWQKNDDPAPA